MLAALLCGWLIADFLSGVVHWLEDEFVTAQTPLIGRLVGGPNELHHLDPRAFLASSFFDRNWTTWAVVVPLGAIWFVVAGFSWVLVGAVAGGALANESHAWAHRTDRPPFIRALQASGVFQSAPAHSRHHRGSMNSDYCTLTGWLNPWLELIGFWQLLGRALARIGIGK